MKRWSLRIRFFAAIGAVTTVNIAWLTVLAVRLETSSRDSGDDASAWVMHSRWAWRTVRILRFEPESAVESSGWPFLALSCRFTSSGSIHLDPAGGWETALDERAFSGHGLFPVVLPLRPIWPGFLIDTLFYGATWFALFTGIGAAKRAHRRRRGRCPLCGYDPRGAMEAGCPECGWNRSGASVEPST